LEQMLTSNKPEFMAIYGRRRIGKTFLIRNFFEKMDLIFFDVMGAKKGTLSQQIKHFTKRIGDVFYNGASLAVGKNWDNTFEILTEAIAITPKDKKIVLFFDEFPWMATKNSRLIQHLDYYWNQHWSKNSKIKLIICGSSASWIIEKIVNSKGGLHNRLTRDISLEPFALSDTKKFLQKQGVNLTNKQITQIYMVTGGVPYYLSKIEKGLSAVQSVGNLAFKSNSFLMKEFDNLFSSLFDRDDIYVEVIRTIARRRYGIGQEELLKSMGKALHGKKGKSILQSLQDTNFIISFKPLFHKRKGIYYKVIDEYTLFYFHWIEPIKDTLLKKGLSRDYWEKIQASTAWHSWAGYAFESICYEHLTQIRKKLGLSATAMPSTWKYVPIKGSKEQGAQIDLLFERDDDAITICEIKYTDKPFEIDKQYARSLLNKVEVFRRKTRTNKQIFIAIISANGLKPTIHSEKMITKCVTLDDLFKD
ncbi:MAG: ATP-binding protein, partial [Gammaproteobacteria bacterium]